MLEGKRIYSIHDYGDKIELCVTGGVLTFTKKEEIEQLREWINEGKRIEQQYGDKVTQYVRYKINEEW